MCYSCNDHFSWAHNGTVRDTRGVQELLDGMYKQTQNSEMPSELTPRYSVCHFLLCAKMAVAEVLHI